MFFFPQNEITSSKILFPEHLPLSQIQSGIKSGKYIQGTFRANRDNFLEGTVFVHGEGDESTEVSVSSLEVKPCVLNNLSYLNIHYGS